MTSKSLAAWFIALTLSTMSVACRREQATESRSTTSSASAARVSDDRSREPGYGSRVHSEPFELNAQEKKSLLRLARDAMEGQVRNGRAPEVPSELARSAHLAADRACFVTLRKKGELRGCIGSLEPRRSLLEDIRQNAVAAAIHDTRFSPVTVDELSSIDVELSILDRPRPLEGVSIGEVPAHIGKHKLGLIIEFRGRRSTFLPSVWEDLPDPYDFLARLCRKQGSAPDCWKDPAAKLSVYGSLHFAEKDPAP